MISRKILYNFAFFSFLLLFSLSSLFAFPSLEFDQSSVSSGEVTLHPKISSGTQVELYINGNFVEEREVFAPSKVILLNDSIFDLQIPLGAQLILKNNRASTYHLLVGNEAITLNPTQEKSFSFSTPGSIIFQDQDSGISRVILVQESLVQVDFPQMEQVLEDGQNTVLFTVHHPSPNFENQENFSFNVNYKKFINDIFLSSFLNITNSSEVKVSGFVSDARFPLFFVLNLDSNLANPGVLQNIPLNGNNFSTKITGLKQGNNSIRFITTESVSNLNLFTGETKINVLSDRTPPTIEILNTSLRNSGGIIQEKGDDILVTKNSIELLVGTDAKNVSFIFENKTQGPFNVVNNTVTLSLNLKEGTNSLTIIAEDEAQNIAKLQKAILLDSKAPELIRDSLSPPEMFSGSKGDARFFFPQIKGKTSEPGVDITIITFNEDAVDLDRRPLSCPIFEGVVFRNLGQLDSEEPDGPELNLNESQLALLDQLSFEFNTKSNSDGNFDAIIVLKERSFTDDDLEDFENRKDTEQRKVSSVESENTICFYLQDSFGNRKVESFKVDLNAGNTQWRVDQVTTIPNSVFAAEIEQRGDSRTGNSAVEFGMLATFQYIGGGEVTDIEKPILRIDKDGSEESKFVSLDTTRQNFLLEKDTGKLTIFVPVQVKPLGKNPLDYPDDLTLAFQMKLSYKVDDLDIPVDTVNPVFFQTKINIERPLDHTKFLTPETIDGMIEILDSAIGVTESLTNFMRTASVFGVVGCTGAKLWHAYQLAEIESTLKGAEKLKAIEDADRQLYLVCDRVACTGAPPICGDNQGGESLLSKDAQEELQKHLDSGSSRKFSIDIIEANAKLTNDEDVVIGLLDEVTIDGRCTLPGDLENEKSGYYVKTEGRLVDQELSSSIRGQAQFIKSEKGTVGFQCLSLEDLSKLNTNMLSSGICYSEGSPHYDDTRCVIPGVTNSQSDRDPASGLISSVACGCVTDTYSHLNNYLRIEEGIRDCLQQAKLGEIEGGYCERLLSQSVCDIATNELLPEVAKYYRSSPGNEKEIGERDFNFFDTIQNTENAFNKRYAGSLFTKGGLGGTQLVNKACVGAITGDWSVLTENILTAIDQNEVDPVLGPAFPESRMQGYNPLTGELSIQYRFTYGVVSGGQNINTKVYLACDPSLPNGEFCPQTYLQVDELSGRSIGSQRVRAGDAVSDLIVLTDPDAKFWFNVLILEHTYDLKGETKKKREEFQIVHKGELAAQCRFGAGPSLGFELGCDTIFSEDSLISQFRIEDTTKMVPASRFFPGNDVNVLLNYDIRSTEGNQKDFFLHYLITCPSVSENTQILDSKKFSIAEDKTKLDDFSSPLGSELITLFTVQEFAAKENAGFTTMDGPNSLNLIKGESYEIKISNQDTTIGKSGKIKVSASSGLQKGLSETTFTLGAGEKGKTLGTLVISEGNLNEIVEEATVNVENLKIEVNGVTEVFVELFRKGETKTPEATYILSRTGSVSFNDFRDLRPGSCTVEMKILPDQERFASPEEFRSFGIGGENIETDINDDDFKLSFSLSTNTKTNEIPEIGLALIEPVDKKSFCYEKSGNTISFPSFSTPQATLLIQSSAGVFNPAAFSKLSISVDLQSSTILGSLLQNGGFSEPFDEARKVIKLPLDTNKIGKADIGRIDAELSIKVKGSVDGGKNVDESFKRNLVISECGDNTDISIK